MAHHHVELTNGMAETCLLAIDLYPIGGGETEQQVGCPTVSNLEMIFRVLLENKASALLPAQDPSLIFNRLDVVAGARAKARSESSGFLGHAAYANEMAGSHGDDGGQAVTPPPPPQLPLASTCHVFVECSAPASTILLKQRLSKNIKQTFGVGFFLPPEQSIVDRFAFSACWELPEFATSSASGPIDNKRKRDDNDQIEPNATGAGDSLPNAAKKDEVATTATGSAATAADDSKELRYVLIQNYPLVSLPPNIASDAVIAETYQKAMISSMTSGPFGLLLTTCNGGNAVPPPKDIPVVDTWTGKSRVIVEFSSAQIANGIVKLLHGRKGSDLWNAVGSGSVGTTAAPSTSSVVVANRISKVQVEAILRSKK